MNYDLLGWVSNVATGIFALFMVGILIVFTIAWMLGIPMPTGEASNRCAPRDVLYLTHPGAVPQHLLVPTCAPLR